MQQPNRVRRIGVLTDYSETDSTALAFLAAFRQGLAALRSIEGNDLYVEPAETRDECSDLF